MGTRTQTLPAWLGWKLNVADAKNSFCQSNRLRGPAGAIYVEPRSRLDFQPDQLIELIATVYGLNDAPI
eukprot:4673362-Pyramimonas_sp.AAC.1